MAGASQPVAIGLRENLAAFTSQLVQVFFVGLMIGMQRTVLPPLAESEFGLARGSALVIGSIIVGFGLVKAAMNLVSGYLSDRLGRRPLLIAGWLAALPIPLILWLAPGWGWVIAANVLLGVNQGFAWSMTVTGKMDIVRPHERGLATALNECAGYGAVALAGIAAGYLAAGIGARAALAGFGAAVVLAALVHALAAFRETLPHARHQAAARPAQAQAGGIFARVTWRDPTFRALTQAGHVEKYVDAMIWLILPLSMTAAGHGLVQIGWIAGIYGLAWGLGQLVSGPLSDRIGRKGPSVAGMAVAALGSAMFALLPGLAGLAIAAAVTGLGMALLYPVLIAAVGDHAEPATRGAALGVYRFWRDFGYAAGALLLGLTADLAGTPAAAFWVAAAAMAGSALWLALGMDETHPPRPRT